MSGRNVEGRVLTAGVAGRPITHSLSPLLHNAWIAALKLDAVYTTYSPEISAFAAFVEDLRAGAIRGLNVTLPFKEEALAAADTASPLAHAAGAANLLLFHDDGGIEARNTDGEGLLYAFTRQAKGFDLTAQPVAIIGAGGAARGAVATLVKAGVCDIRIINRTRSRAEVLARNFSKVTAWSLEEISEALDGAGAVINATSTEIAGDALRLDFSSTAKGAVAMDMLYKPLETQFLANAKARGLRTVDGLDMLIGQAIPSFEAFFGVEPPASVDARALLLNALEVR